MMLEYIENGPLVYLTIEEKAQIRNKKYAELTKQEKLQDDYDVQATNIVLQGLPPDVYSLINHFQTAKDCWANLVPNCPILSIAGTFTNSIATNLDGLELNQQSIGVIRKVLQFGRWNSCLSANGLNTELSGTYIYDCKMASQQPVVNASELSSQSYKAIVVYLKLFWLMLYVTGFTLKMRDASALVPIIHSTYGVGRVDLQRGLANSTMALCGANLSPWSLIYPTGRQNGVGVGCGLCVIISILGVDATRDVTPSVVRSRLFVQ
ncbi:hypothetical protein Tco_0600064 [Tanacetum coccineum]|uniref:Uncharacterized protein n=1 Tax=Tanacetum coccineum TaxID=301880 RepID=A0ABQ4WAU3_9ASTR